MDPVTPPNAQRLAPGSAQPAMTKQEMSEMLSVMDELAARLREAGTAETHRYNADFMSGWDSAISHVYHYGYDALQRYDRFKRRIKKSTGKKKPK